MPNYNLSYDITIPVLNEENRLYYGINALADYLKSICMENYTITISDNGSTDKTRFIAEELIVKNKKVRYISVGKRGVGLALKTAWNQSNADIIGYMDVDLAADINCLKKVFNLFEATSSDVVNGSRNLSDSSVKNRSFLRTITSHGYNKILKFILGVHFSDGMCGFKFLRNSVYKKLMELKLRNDGWFFCTEILYMAEKNGFYIQEIPVKWTDDRDSRVQLVKTIIYYLSEIFKLRFRKLTRCNNE